MDRKQIFDEVKETLLESVGKCCCFMDGDVTMLASLQDDLGIDSLDCSYVAEHLEAKFGIDLSDDEIEAWWTEEDIVNTLASKI